MCIFMCVWKECVSCVGARQRIFHFISFCILFLGYMLTGVHHGICQLGVCDWNVKWQSS